MNDTRRGPEVTLNPSGHRPTPFEVWKSKQAHTGQAKKVTACIFSLSDVKMPRSFLLYLLPL